MTDSPWIDERQKNFSWNFSERGLDDRQKFISAFVEYNDLLDADPSAYDFPLLRGPAAVVRFFGVPDDAGEDEDEDDEGDYKEMEVLVRSADGAPIRFLEFMHELHKHVQPYLDLADHVHYEGLSFETLRDGIPVLKLEQGS